MKVSERQEGKKAERLDALHTGRRLEGKKPQGWDQHETRLGDNGWSKALRV
jgi:hypothetical protein